MSVGTNLDFQGVLGSVIPTIADDLALPRLDCRHDIEDRAVNGIDFDGDLMGMRDALRHA